MKVRAGEEGPQGREPLLLQGPPGLKLGLARWPKVGVFLGEIGEPG